MSRPPTGNLTTTEASNMEEPRTVNLNTKTRVRANACYLWGQSGAIDWNRCHWFKTLDGPAK